jgi:hypothetical protein
MLQVRILLASASVVAALGAGPSAALAQAQPFCLKSESGMANCAFQTAAQCEAARGVNIKAQCIPNSQISTVGAGGGMQPGGSARQGPRSPTPSPTR